jgi:CHASE3 domain sensor protein
MNATNERKTMKLLKPYIAAKNWIRERVDALRERADNLVAEQAETGDQIVSWVLIILAVIVIAGIAVAAVTAYVNSKTGQLGS